jgi:hypothetical protein
LVDLIFWAMKKEGLVYKYLKLNNDEIGIFVRRNKQ